jgi:hypothetical protein
MRQGAPSERERFDDAWEGRRALAETREQAGRLVVRLAGGGRAD